MADMIERVAQSITDAHLRKLSPEEQAHAAIAAMREPTEGMIEAGAWKICSCRACECDEKTIFQAMIDAAPQEDRP